MNKETFTPYNPFEYLAESEYRRQHLANAFVNPNSRVFIKLLKHAFNWYGTALLAEIANLSRENLYKIMNDERQPSLATAHALIQAISSPQLDHFNPAEKKALRRKIKEETTA